MRNRVLRHALRPVQALESRVVPAILDFTLIQAQSSIALSGNLAGLPFTAQGAGSLSSTYTGTIRADINLATNEIFFYNDGAVIDGTVTGNWQPAPGGAAGSAPADYGGAVVLAGLVFAVRDGTAAFSSSAPLTMTGTGMTRSFPSTQTFVLVSGTQDYNAGALGSGSDSIANLSATNSSSTDGTFVDLGDGSARLTTPLVAVYTGSVAGNPITENLSGTLQGLTPFPTVDPNGSATGFNTSVNFTAGSAPVTLAPSLETRRLPSGNLESATITLSPRPDGAAESLGVTLSGGLTSTGYDSGTGTLTITGSAPLSTYQTVLRSITYANSLPGATAGTRTASFVVNDGTTDSFSHDAAIVVSAGAAPRVTGVTVNAGQANLNQRSKVTTLTVTFSTQVTFAQPGNVAAAFGISRIGGGQIGGFTATPSVVGGVTVVTLSGFSGAESEFSSLADGRFSVLVRANQVTANGQQLDGDGNGTGGDDYTLNGTIANKLFRLFGDVDGDGFTNAFDFGQFRPAFGTSVGNAGYVDYLDIDGSGVINAFDFGQFRPRFGSQVP